MDAEGRSREVKADPPHKGRLSLHCAVLDPA
jgi:hypothetical protein